jgi:hypothetical protein
MTCYQLNNSCIMVGYETFHHWLKCPFKNDITDLFIDAVGKWNITLK